MSTHVGERPYLSIGEVLGLLLEEFPDVTISKIRFLESQGLIDPERTPSGYRKFYEHDVERLRVILREQRENYLPLRVIRDRLERGDIDADGSGSHPTPRGVRNVEVPAASLAGHPSAAAPKNPVSAGSTEPSHTAAAPAGAASASSPPASSAVSPGGEPPPDAPRPGERIRPATATPAPAPPVPTSAAANPRPDRAGSTRTREELCAAAGLTLDQLADLESYGLIAGRGSGMATMYTDEACAIAAIASKFLARGVDARHLRAWKTSADREAGLFEQRILPLMRQRNPQARQQALATLRELTDLGGQLHAAMVDAAIRHLE